MDKIKKIKIKQQDGTLSDYYPIGADAQNIDLDYNGSNVESTLKKKPYYYDNIAAMKADDALKVGDMAITLGYYEVNDGGGAEYRIVNGNYIDDGGSYHKLNNNLFAQSLIKLNIKQWGIISEISNSYITYCTTNNYPIVFTAGEYNVNNTITINPYNKIICLGEVVLNIKSSIGFKIERSELDSLTYDNRYRNNKIFDLSEGNLILIGTKNNIAIEIGTNNSSSISYLNNYPFINISDIRITDFQYGINLLMNRLYLESFDNMIISKCNTCINFSSFVIDSGENIIFNHCTFGGSTNIINMPKTAIDLTFNECSFDFFGTLLSTAPTELRYSNIVFNNCHIEGMGTTSNVNPQIYENYWLVNNTGTAPINITLDKCHFNSYSNIIDYSNIFKGRINLKIDWIFYYTFAKNNIAQSTNYLCDENVQILDSNYLTTTQWNYFPLSKTLNYYINYDFHLNESGQHNNDLNINNVITNKGNTNGIVKEIITEDNNNVLKISQNTGSTLGTYFDIWFGKIYAKAGDIIEASLLYKTIFTDMEAEDLLLPIYFDWYDINDNLIRTTESSNKPQSNYNKYPMSNSYVRPAVGMRDIAPIGTYYCIPRLQGVKRNCTSTDAIYIKEIFITVQ